jgi:hypothetical protein
MKFLAPKIFTMFEWVGIYDPVTVFEIASDLLLPVTLIRLPTQYFTTFLALAHATIRTARVSVKFG